LISGEVMRVWKEEEKSKAKIFVNSEAKPLLIILRML